MGCGAPAGGFHGGAHVQAHVVVHNLRVVSTAAPEVVGADGVLQRRHARLRDRLVCKINDPGSSIFDVASSGGASSLEPARVHGLVLDDGAAHAVLRSGPAFVRRPQPLAAAVFRVEVGEGARAAGLLGGPVISPRDAICAVRQLQQLFNRPLVHKHTCRHGRAHSDTHG